MNNKQIYMIVGLVLVVGIASFFGGMQFQKSRVPSFAGRQMFSGRQTGTSGARGMQTGKNGSQPISGTITATESGKITVKTRDGSSKIVYISDATTVTKSTAGSTADLKNDEEVMVIGTTDATGTVTATTIAVGGAWRMPAGNGQAGNPPENQLPQQ